MQAFFDRLYFGTTFSVFKWEVKRMRARLRTEKMKRRIVRLSGGVLPDQLHLGCGRRRLPRWLNVDIADSDIDLDLATGRLPFADASFTCIVSQHVIEHLTVGDELDNLLIDMHRCLRPGGDVWISCPDLDKVCRSYVEDGGEALLKDRLTRWPGEDVGPYPASHVVNKIFFQDGEHRNLLDFALLQFLLQRAGFEDVVQVNEADLLVRFPGFPQRKDDLHTIYVRASRAMAI